MLLVVTLDSPREFFTLLPVYIIFLLGHVLQAHCTLVVRGVFGGLVLQYFNVGLVLLGSY